MDVCLNETGKKSGARRRSSEKMKYLVKTSFMAVHRRSDGTSEFLQLEPGTVFTIRGRVQAGMVNIMHNRRVVAVFEADVKERAEQIAEH